MQALIAEEDITESDSDANSSHSTEDALVSPDLWMVFYFCMLSRFSVSNCSFLFVGGIQSSTKLPIEEKKERVGDFGRIFKRDASSQRNRPEPKEVRRPEFQLQN